MNRDEFIKQVRLFISYLESIKATNDEGLSEEEKLSFNIAKNQLNALRLVQYGLVCNPSIVYKLGSPEEEIIASYEYVPQKYYSKFLNASQKDAVNKALNMNDILVIQGPPGTGKTTVITETIMQLKNKNPKARFLVTSASHLAVDNVLECLSANGFDIPMIRIKSTVKRKQIESFEVNAYLENYFNNFKGSKELLDSLKLYYQESLNKEIKNIAKNFDVVAVTLNAIMGTHFDVSSPFDYVIIDESAKSTLPEICSCLITAKKVIFIGDNKQLTPVIQSEDEEADERTRYLGENSYIEYLFTHIHPSSRAFLNMQFRMSNNIGSFVSDEFYQNPKLLNGADKPNENGLNYVTYLPKEKVSSAKDINRQEGDIIEDVIALLPKDKEIAIISPYKKQIEYLQKRFAGKGYRIGTIDSFQGQGVDIVLCSMSRNNGSSYFVSNPNRVNVAISRAKEQFWLIGNKKYLEKVELFKHYYCYSKNGKSLVNGYEYDSGLIKK